MPTTQTRTQPATTYSVRDLLIDVAADDDVWTKLGEPAKLVAAIQPLVEAAQILGDDAMLGNLRLCAALREVDRDVEWRPSQRSRPLERPLPMQTVVPLLREAGQTRDPVRLMALAMSTADLRGLGRCGRLLASTALALGALRVCRIFVLSARTVGGVAAPP